MGADQPAEVADDAPSNLVYLLFCIKILYCVYKKIMDHDFTMSLTLFLF